MLGIALIAIAVVVAFVIWSDEDVVRLALACAWAALVVCYGFSVFAAILR